MSTPGNKVPQRTTKKKKLKPRNAKEQRELLKESLELIPSLAEGRKDFDHIVKHVDSDIILKQKQQMINPALRNVITGPDGKPRYLASPDKFFG